MIIAQLQLIALWPVQPNGFKKVVMLDKQQHLQVKPKQIVIEVITFMAMMQLQLVLSKITLNFV